MLLFGGIALGESDACSAPTQLMQSPSCRCQVSEVFSDPSPGAMLASCSIVDVATSKVVPAAFPTYVFCILKISKGSSIDWGPLRATQRIPAWIGESS